MTPFAGECQEVFVAAVPFDLFSDPGHFVLVEKARRARGEKNDRGNGWFFLSYVFRHTVFERPLRLRFFDKVSYLVTTTCFFVAMMLLGGVRKWTILLSVASGYSVATYYLFGKVLMVALK